MKTAAIDLRCLTEAQGSGVAMYTRRLLRALADVPEVQNTHWYAWTSGRTQRPFTMPLSAERKHANWSNTLLNASIAVTGKPEAKTLVGEIDFLWQPNPMFFPDVPYRHVVSLHDISFRHFPEFFPWHTRQWYLRWVLRFLERAPRNVHLLANSEYTRADLLATYPQWRDRISVQLVPPPELQSARPLPAKRTVLFVGTLEPRKNILSLIAAFQSFARTYEAELVILGKPTRFVSERMLRKVPNVRLVGYCSDEEREAWYRKAWCVVYPSFYEGYGLPPLEAMAHGVPVIATNVSAVPELLENSALLIDPYRAGEEIAAALQALASQPALYAQIAAAGQARISELHSSFTLRPILDVWYGNA